MADKSHEKLEKLKRIIKDNIDYFTEDQLTLLAESLPKKRPSRLVLLPSLVVFGDIDNEETTILLEYDITKGEYIISDLPGISASISDTKSYPIDSNAFIFIENHSL